MKRRLIVLSLALSFIVLIFVLLQCKKSGSTKQSDPGDQSNYLVKPFPLDQVTLLDSPFFQNRDRKLAYLAFIDPDRLLYTFRQNVGLSTEGAEPLGGWEAPDHGLRGHSIGHFISALSYAYLSTQDIQYKEKADYLVNELRKCQEQAAASGYSAGYLAAFPESRIDQLLNLETTWAPLYCIHKTFAGMLDSYLLLDNQEALKVAIDMGDWIYNRLKDYPSSHLNSMWDFMNWNAGEYGGFNESLATLYEITKNQNYITAAKFFDHSSLFEPCYNDIDQLNGLHANTQIPKIIGALTIYDKTGEIYYKQLAENFWNMVVNAHTYVNGGNSNEESFRAPNAIISQLGDKTTETCNSYNMLKLTRLLYFYDPKPEYMDYYERTLYNHILASQDPSSDHGFVTYFVPLRSGGIRTYGNDFDSFYCCDGTGLENHTKYQDTIYAYTDDAVYVNLYIPSILKWDDKGFEIKQEGTYMENGASILTINGSGSLSIKLRVPYWADDFSVYINDTKQDISISPSSYVTLTNKWNVGDKIKIEMPFNFRIDYAPDAANIGALMAGPLIYVANHGDNDVGRILNLSLNTDDLGQSILPIGDMKFTSNDLEFIPFYQAHHLHYSVYFTINGNDDDGNKVLEVELEDLSDQSNFSPFEVQSDSSASGGQFIVWPNDGSDQYLSSASDSATGQVEIAFTLSEPTYVQFQIQADLPNGNDDSFYYKMDSGSWDTQNNTFTTGWEVLLPKIFTEIAAGDHTLKIIRREDGAKLDKVILTVSAGEIAGN